MRYGIFTTSEAKFRAQATEIFDNNPNYKGYKTLPMLQWTRHRVFLRDGTDVHWIDPSKNLDFQLCGLRFNRIYVLDGVSNLQMLEYVLPRFCAKENFT